MAIKLKALGLLLGFISLPVLCMLLVNYFGVYMAYFLFGVCMVFCYVLILRTLQDSEEFKKRFSK